MKDTDLAQIALTQDHTGAIANPIYLSTAYQHPHLGESTGYDYTRTKNPTRTAFEEAFAQLEKGIASFATSSGMAAIQLICNIFKPGDEILVAFDLYGGTFRLFDFYEKQYGLKFKYVDFLNYEEVEKNITPQTRALFIEPISNPQMIEIDVEPYYILSKKHQLLTIIDNTFLTPYLSTPLEEGADIVLHSATKYIGGRTGMLSLRLNQAYSVAKFLENLDICIFAESLGGTETFITFPYTQTHVDMPDEEKDKRGIDEYLIRLSVGIEDYNDIEADIIQALENSKVGVIS